MQIEFSSVISIVSGIIAFGLSTYLALSRHTDKMRDSEVSRRIGELERGEETVNKDLQKEFHAVKDRMHADEMAALQLRSDLALVRQIQQTHNDAMEDIRREIVTKAEFESRMSGIERTMERMLDQLQRIYPSSSYRPPSVQMSTPPRGDPSKK